MKTITFPGGSEALTGPAYSILLKTYFNRCFPTRADSDAMRAERETMFSGLHDWLEANCPDHRFNYTGMNWEDCQADGFFDVVYLTVHFDCPKSAALAKLFLPAGFKVSARQASSEPE